MSRVYCAGPLFNSPEKMEMESIAGHLERAGYSVFLPHRDGIELSRIEPSPSETSEDESSTRAALGKGIFALDVYELLDRADAVVANLNGRVPDEGTVVEAALAWHAGKAVILYKQDARSVLQGSDNPMLGGLGKFRVVTEMKALPAAVEAELRRNRRSNVTKIVSLGRKLSRGHQSLRRNRNSSGLILSLIRRYLS